MPLTQKLDCTEDDLTTALLNHNENLASIQKSMQDTFAELKIKTAEVQSTFLTPFENNLQRLLAPTGLSVYDMATEMGLLPETSKKDNEIYMQSRYNVSIVNGRLLIPGNIDLKALKELRRLLGSTDSINVLLPELHNLDLANAYSLTPLPSRFIFLITKVDTNTIEDSKCALGYSTTTEVLIGTNISIQSILKAYPTLKREDLQLYLFWVGEPIANKMTRRLAVQYGLTSEEFSYALAGLSIDTLHVFVISNSMDFVTLTAKYGGTGPNSDTDAILDRGPDTLNTDPDPADIVKETEKVMPRQSGSTTPVGAIDCNSGPSNLFNTMDIDKTFGVIENLPQDPCLNLTNLGKDISAALLNASKVMNAVTTAISTPQRMLNNINNEIATLTRPVINQLTKLLSIVSNLLGNPDFLKCYFTANFSIDLALGAVLGPLNAIMSLLDKGAKLLYDFLDLISMLCLLLGQVACIQGALSQIFNISEGVVSRLATTFGLHCAITFKPNFGECFQKGINIAQTSADFMNTLLNSLVFNLRSLQMFISNLQTNLKGSMASSSAGSLCNPAETALLTAILTKLSLASDQVPIGF